MQWHPFTLLFPDIPEGQEWEAFRAGIEATGGNKLMPIFARMVNGKPQGLAGRNRYRACKELRIKPTIKFVTLKDEEVEGFIIRDNINRRHMTPELRQALVAKLREQGQSTRQIADTLQVDQKTVRNDLQVSGEEFSSPETVKGRDGKHYSATQDSPVHCRRCTRMGTAVKDCPQCAEAQVKAAAKARAI